MLTIPTIDLTETEKLQAEMDEHPLVRRRRAVEAAFMGELTALARKYGLAIRADTRMEYGEHYPDCQIETVHNGTEAAYTWGTWGLTFEAVENAPSATREEIATFRAAKAARAEEDGAIRALRSAVRDASWKAYQESQRAWMTDMVTRYAEEQRPVTFPCRCGNVYKTKGALSRHAQATGHEGC